MKLNWIAFIILLHAFRFWDAIQCLRIKNKMKIIPTLSLFALVGVFCACGTHSFHNSLGTKKLLPGLQWLTSEFMNWNTQTVVVNSSEWPAFLSAFF